MGIAMPAAADMHLVQGKNVEALHGVGFNAIGGHVLRPLQAQLPAQ